MATRGYYEEYNLEELKDTLPEMKHRINSYTPSQSIEEIHNKTDDKFLSNTWTQAYKFAAYYYDNPNINDRSTYLNSFRFNFSGLMKGTNMPTEIPDMKSRNNFVGWVCKKHNEFLEKEEAEFRVECNNEKLLQAYGPNYGNVKSRLGGSEFFY